MINTTFKLLFACTTLLTLTSCGGGSTSTSFASAQESSLIDSVAQPENYSGLREPVLLDENNTLDFVHTLFGLSAINDLNTLPTQLSARTTNPPNASLAKVMSLLDRIAEFEHSTDAHQRVFTQACANQGVGTLTIDDRFTNNLAKSAIIYQFNSCQIFPDRNTISGQVVLVTEPDTRGATREPLYKRIDVRNLNINSGNENYNYSGSQNYQTVIRYNTGETGGSNWISTTWTAETNLSERSINSGKTNLIRNLKRSFVEQPDGQSSTIAGYLFNHDQGYVKLAGSDDLALTQDEFLLRDGHLFFRGASNSAAAIQLAYSPENEYRYNVMLDHDGDGNYEAATLTDAGTESETVFATDLTPKAVLKVDNHSNVTELKSGDYIRLSAVESIDLNAAFTDLKFDWTLEEKPHDSTETLEIGTSYPYRSELRLDKVGEYKISLKVTDPDGNSDLAVMNFIIADQPPKITLSSHLDTQNGHIELGKLTYLGFSVWDHEDSWQQAQLYPYTWTLQSPDNSSAYLERAHREEANLTPDVPGTYIVTYQTTDSGGNTVAESVTLKARNTPPTAVIETYSTVGNGGMVVGKVIELYSYASHDPGLDHHGLKFSWDIVSAPAGSQAQITNLEGAEPINAAVTFIPDVVGHYRFSLTATDQFGASHTSYKNLNIIAR